MQISEGPSSTLAVKKHNAFSVAFFCSFFQIRGLLQAFFWKHTFKFQVNHWMEFWKPWAGHSWQFELQDWKLHVSNSFDREFRSKKDLQKTEHEAVKTLVHSGYVNIISRTAECESLVVCFFSMVMGHFDTSWFSQGVNSLILGLKNKEWEIFNLNVILVHTQTILEVMEIVVQFHCLSLYQICIQTTNVSKILISISIHAVAVTTSQNLVRIKRQKLAMWLTMKKCSHCLCQIKVEIGENSAK